MKTQKQERAQEVIENVEEMVRSAAEGKTTIILIEYEDKTGEVELVRIGKQSAEITKQLLEYAAGQIKVEEKKTDSILN